MLWREIEQRVRAVIGDTPLTLIVHDVKFVNREIRIGQYFFGDIANEGVALYDSRKFTLAKPKALNAEERLALAERNFASWFDSAGKFWRGSRDYGARLWLKAVSYTHLDVYKRQAEPSPGTRRPAALWCAAHRHWY